jgi:hypothetical protein
MVLIQYFQQSLLSGVEAVETPEQFPIQEKLAVLAVAVHSCLLVRALLLEVQAPQIKALEVETEELTLLLMLTLEVVVVPELKVLTSLENLQQVMVESELLHL